MYYRCTRSNPIHSLFCHIFHSSIRSVPFDVSGRKCVNVFFFSLHFFFHVSLQFIYLRSDYEAFNYLRGSNGWSAVLWWKMTSTASYQQGAGEEFLKRKCDWLIIFPFFFLEYCEKSINSQCSIETYTLRCSQRNHFYSEQINRVQHQDVVIHTPNSISTLSVWCSECVRTLVWWARFAQIVLNMNWPCQPFEICWVYVCFY